jgi:ADP-ribosylglycohydrolase
MDEGFLGGRFVGSAIGTMVGDALGMPVEGWHRAAIQARFGLLASLEDGRFPEGHYTDDTEMMIGILEVLAEHGDFNPDSAAKRFLENFHPERGYGGRIYALMDRLRRGIPWDQVATDSFGNGAAMRIAPIGFFYFQDFKSLRDNAILSCKITHLHAEAIAGAVAQAMAVGLAVGHSMQGKPLAREEFLDRITGEVQHIHGDFAKRLSSIKSIPKSCLHDNIQNIANHFICDVRSIEAIPPAIASFLLTDNFRDAVVTGINLGGDTDTIGAMTGAIAGAYYGYAEIPEQWTQGLENITKGRDYVIGLAKRCAGHVARR